ncbi:hypothetical protein C7212DRAFT_347823 [Tuber magnatum]|uniref:Uncharacterized protein n=1 Tax=Tuber magnatum TaxID=42249 RepID=A0A317SHA2_9PEZI|nr:hypothetical protein C7212DRAFT_347823 [Tuber magnatum]
MGKVQETRLRPGKEIRRGGRGVDPECGIGGLELYGPGENIWTKGLEDFRAEHQETQDAATEVESKSRGGSEAEAEDQPDLGGLDSQIVTAVNEPSNSGAAQD